MSKKKIFFESGHGLVWAEWEEKGCPAKIEDYFITEEDLLKTDLVKKAIKEARLKERERAYSEGYKKGYWQSLEEDLESEEMEKADEAHRTAEGYCCACGYDMAVMQEKIEEAYQRGLEAQLKTKK